MYETLHHRFWALLNAIINSGKDVRLASLETNDVRFVINQKRLLVVLMDEQPQNHIALQNWAKVLLEESAAREIDVIVLTPSDEVDRTLSQTEFQVPWTTRLAIFTLHEDGVYREITQGRGDALVRGCIEASLTERFSGTSVEELRNNFRAFLRTDNEKRSELQQFQRSMQGHSAFATYALLGVIGVTYLIQLWLKSDNYGPGLVRLGADSAILVQKGEYWRLVTSIFLHGGLLHVAANSYVLFALGTFFNKLIGNTRFLTLFFLSGIAGSLASVLISQSALSVGASGALWGLFGLSAALTIKRSDFLPDAVRQNLRNITVLNLAINLVFSFAVPMIDKWAHFGGGIAGLLIGFAFIFEPKYRAQEWVHRVLATGMCCIAALCVAANLYVQKPWILAQPLTFTARSIFKDEVVIDIPSFLVLEKATDDSALFGRVFLSPNGAVYFDPYVVSVSRQQLTPGASLASVRMELESDTGTRLDEKQIGGFTTFTSTFTGNEKQAALWNWFQIREGLLYSVQVIGEPGAPPNLIDNLDRIIESMGPANRI